MSKPVLYYSNYCDYCKAVTAFVTKNDIRGKLAYVCVDTHRHLVPRLVTSVPSLIIATERTLLKDEKVMEYLQACCGEKQALADVEAMDMNSALAESYSWVDESRAGKETDDARYNSGSRFVPATLGCIDGSCPTRGGLPEPIAASSLKADVSSETDAALARLKMERDADFRPQQRF